MTSAAALLFLFAPPARAQQAWPPPVPAFARSYAARRAACPGCRALDAGVEQGLERIAKKDVSGLGAEAAAVRRWLSGKDGVRLGGGRLVDRSGASLALSPELSRALDRVGQYFGMTPETLAHPIDFAELSSALTSPAGAAAVQALFEQAIAERIVFGATVQVPELGGEVTLGAALEFRQMPDLTRALWRKVAAAHDDPAALTALYDADPEGMKLIDENGLLRNALRGLPLWEARGVPAEQRAKVLRLSVASALETSGDTFTFEPDAQFAAILGQDWSGRYLGRWHTHPPEFLRSGWGAAEGPSDADMKIALDSGQNLTLAFSPDGFTAYDLSALDASTGPDRGLIGKVEYRSAAWRERFAALHAAVRTATP